MASSRNSSRSSAPDLAARVAAQLQGIVKPRDRLVVGLSGGVDSVVLLDCLRRVARSLRLRVSALHVNHQLSPNAARWAAFCRRLCRDRGIAFESVKVRVRRGDSLEAAARSQRYAAYANQDCEYVVLAHHRDDQVETLLLQLLRGAGVKGLAAMPLVRKAEGRRQKAEETKNKPGHPSSFILHPSILRPLLDVTRQEILSYANTRKLKWVEDESNLDLHFNRNFVRREVLPVIARRFPAYRATIARAARHLGETSGLLDELAAADMARQVEEGGLALAALRRLSPARARNLLRYFLASRGATMPDAARLDEALRQSLSAKQDARVQFELGDHELHRFRDRLHVVPRVPPVHREYARRWRGESRLDLRELGGVLDMVPSRGRGVSLERLRGRAVTIRVRRGGERLRPDRRRPRRSLKNLLRETRVPPWQRERLPLIFCGEELVWVPELGADCAFRATRGEAALHPGWVPYPSQA